MNQKLPSFIALCLVIVTGSIAIMNREKNDDSQSPDVRAQQDTPRISNRERGTSPNNNLNWETKEELTEMEKLGIIERDKMTEMWLKSAATGFRQTEKNLETDLQLTTAQAGKVEAIFARREKELAGLLSMNSSKAGNNQEIMGKICPLIRNKGLRDDLQGVLSVAQLKTFDEQEAKHEQEMIEARAYRDLAEVNAVVPLTDSQKQEVLEALGEQAAEKVEDEADARAFMALMYGGLAAEMDSSVLQGLSHMLNSNPSQTLNFELGSPEYEQWALEQRAERIKTELAPLQKILNEDQLTRYRRHLEKKPAL